jgi:hypothetical protein
VNRNCHVAVAGLRFPSNAKREIEKRKPCLGKEARMLRSYVKMDAADMHVARMERREMRKGFGWVSQKERDH